MKSKVFLLVACAIVCLITVHLVQSRFWDSKRVEKAVRANISIGSSEQTVVEWLSRSGIEHRRIINADSTFSRQTVVIDSHLKPNQIGSLIVGSTREGFTLDDLYTIDICFFFDKKGRLIKYDFQKLWVGL